MTEPLAKEAWVFDTGPLRHFASQGWLRVLDFLAGDRVVMIPESVERELRDQAHELPVLNEVLEANWIMTDRSADLEYLTAFARYEERLVVNGRNRGECGVLALGKVRGHEIVLDDAVARTIAEEDGLKVTATMSLLCQAIREKKLTLEMVEKLADDLLSGEYFLPFGPGDFRQCALELGLLDYPIGD